MSNYAWARLSSTQQSFDFFNKVKSPLIEVYAENNTPCIKIADIYDVKNLVSGPRIYKDNELIYTISGKWGYAPYTTVLFSNNFVYLLSGSHHASYSSILTRYAIVYHNVNGTLFTNCKVTENEPIYIESLILEDYLTSEKYKYGSMLEYIVDCDFIHLSSKWLFTNANPSVKTNIVIPELLNCSNVTPLQFLTIEGHDYYALGSNTIVPVEAMFYG